METGYEGLAASVEKHPAGETNRGQKRGPLGAGTWLSWPSGERRTVEEGRREGAIDTSGVRCKS